MTERQDGDGKDHPNPRRDDPPPRIGGKLRRLRKQRGWTQSELAARLSLSASYLNLIEHNRRRAPGRLLLRLADLFELDFASLADDDESRLQADVMAVFGDRLFADSALGNRDAQDLVSAGPQLARAFLHLYGAWHAMLTDMRSLAAQIDGADDLPLSAATPPPAPAEVVSDIIQEVGNYFPDLEDAADRTGARIGGHTDPALTRSADALTAFLTREHGVRVVPVTPPVGRDFQRRFDGQRQILEISTRMSPQSRRFQLAHQLGQLSAAPVLDMLVKEHRITDAQTAALARIAFANVFAAALIMPYDPFLRAATDLRYDIELLQHRFGVSFEQACHRLTSLNRPSAPGIPLHMLRVDPAGNISKRFSASGLPIPRHGGACARWNVYAALFHPQRMQVRVSRLPDGAAYFCIARAVRKGGPGHDAQLSLQSIGIGCEVKYAPRMIYADGIDLDRAERFSDIGIACRICERMDCAQRAFPPVHLPYRVDTNHRGASPYVAPGWPWHHDRRGGPTR